VATAPGYRHHGSEACNPYGASNSYPEEEQADNQEDDEASNQSEEMKAEHENPSHRNCGGNSHGREPEIILRLYDQQSLDKKPSDKPGPGSLHTANMNSTLEGCPGQIR
jgi:hypothetical protein